MYGQIPSIAGFVLLWLGGLVQAAVPRGVNLAALDNWDIVVATEALPSETYAAEEFQRYVAEATGRTLPMVTNSQQSNRHWPRSRPIPRRVTFPSVRTITPSTAPVRIVLRSISARAHPWVHC